MSLRELTLQSLALFSFKLFHFLRNTRGIPQITQIALLLDSAVITENDTFDRPSLGTPFSY